MTTFDFNAYTAFQNYEAEIDPVNYTTILNSPTTMTNIFQFTSKVGFQSYNILQTVVMDAGDLIYTREYNTSTYVYTAWITNQGGGGNILDWMATPNNGGTPTLVNGTNTGFTYKNTSSGTNLVNFGAGDISFNQNDTVSYNVNTAQWYNSGQASGIQSITSPDSTLLITTTSGNVTAIVNNTVRQKANNYQFLPTDRIVETTVNNLIITLPAPNAVPVGTVLTTKNTGSVILTTFSAPISYTLNGVQSLTISGLWNSLSAESNGVSWSAI